MKATVSRKALATALKHVTPVIAKGSSLPVLGGVRIEATSAGLDLCCSNIELTATSLVVDANEVTAGVAIPPAQRLQKIVDKLGGDNVTLELEENILTITSGETVATVRTWMPDEWPKLQAAEGETVLWSEADVAAIERIVPMAAVDSERQLLLGIYLGQGDAMATDSYRLGIVHDLPDFGIEAVVPAAALRIILAEAGPVEVTVGPRDATFVVGERTVTTRLIEGEYPDCRKLVPAKRPHSMTFVRTELDLAIQRASLAAVADTKTKSSKSIRVERDGDKARVWATDPDTGASVSDVIGCRGDFELPIGWNPDYLGQLLDAADSDEVTFELVDNLKPSVVCTGRLTLLLMPVRIGVQGA